MAEQVIEDAVTGLTFQFEVLPNGENRFRVFGNLPFGNRDFVFDAEGKEAGSGTAVASLCKPSWMTDVE